MTVTIHCHHDIGDDSEHWTITDDGGEFDDASHDELLAVGEDVQERHHHYAAMADITVVIRYT